MSTLEFLSESRRTRISQETIDIYAPLAHRLGIYWVKSELEDLSFKFLKPSLYETIQLHVSKSRKEREKYINEVVKMISEEMQKNQIISDISGRPKNFYSIFQKMEASSISFDEIYDLIAFRILVPTVMDCYSALGVIHSKWRPIPGRFKDYIAMPKPNNYQSLHTTVIGPDGHRIEIQIRTSEMHDTAEKGIAAHWKYKDSAGSAKLSTDHGMEFAWLKDLIESEKLLHDPYEFMSSVKDDLFAQEVFVFSPKGDLIALPAGSTPIDFAFHIHSDVGRRCSGVRVNGQQVPFSYRLRNGDTIEVITSEHQAPSKDWLDYVVTTKAKQRIRSWIKHEEISRSLAVGKELLAKDLRKVKINLAKAIKDGSLLKVAEALGLKDVDTLLAEVGYGKVSSNQVVQKLLPNEKDIDEKLAKQETPLQRIFQKAARAFKDTSGVKVHGLDDVVFRFAKCCEPLPGDPLVGYVTRGRGVAIHTRGCVQTHSFDPRRLVAVSWDDKIKTYREISLRVFGVDKIGLLSALSQCIANNGANIASAQVTTSSDGKTMSTFEIKIENALQLRTITRALEAVDGVIWVERRTKLTEPEVD
jgi:GTP pyrophosphokinase